MVVIERTSSLSSSSSCRKTEKQSRGRENDILEVVVKGRSVKRASSFSSPSSSSSSPMKKKEKLNGSCLIKEAKPIQRASSFSSSPLKKEKKIMTGNSELPLRRGRSLLSCSSALDSPKSRGSPREGQVRKEKRAEGGRKSSSLVVKSKIRELGPICKKRKEVLDSIQVEDDVDVYFDKQIDEGGMINPDDCFWLSSGNMTPQELGLFMNALDPLDEWVISFLPTPSGASGFADVSKAAVKTAAVLPKPLEENEVKNEVKECAIASIIDQSIESSSNCSSSLALSTYTNNSAFWNMDRTGVWVSLINLEGEDSKLISDAVSESGELDPDFPSPTYAANWDTCSSSDVGISSSARSTQESSQSDWSSDLLSDSLDWDVESDDPIFWPSGSGSGWDQTLDSFSVSPRKGALKTTLDFPQDGIVSPPGSIKFRLHHGRRENSKEGVKRRILFVSGLTASKIIEFKKGCRKKFSGGTSHRRSKIGKRGGRYNRRVPPILETDLEGISPKETPTKQTLKVAVKFNSDLLSESEDWGDEMDSDGPLVWPSDQKQDWDVTCDFLNISPRKNAVNLTSFGSPKGGFTVSSSVRLKFRPDKKAKTKPGCSILGLGASKSLKFKPGSFKTLALSRRRPVLKPTPLRLSPSCRSMVVIVPSKKTTMVKPAEFNFHHTITRVNASHGKRIRAMPLKIGKSVQQFLRLVSAAAVNRKFPEGELTSEELPIETVMGLSAFDGHEGVDMDFEEADFSFEECMRE